VTRLPRRLSLAFAAGAVGGLANGLAVWFAGDAGITHRLGVAIAPALSAAWLYPRIVWGGLWGFLFLLSTSAPGPLSRGLLLSLAPSLFQLLVVFPYWSHQGMLGLHLGLLTPVAVLVFNAVWGIVAAFWLQATN
jgi:hypothetical protein